VSAQESIQTRLGAAGGVYLRQHHLIKAGDFHRGHKHHFNHVTLVQRGAVLCEVEGRPSLRLAAPVFVVIDKDKVHRFTALTDDTLYYCIFALRDPEGEVTDRYSGDDAPYDGVVDTHCDGCRGCQRGGPN
jgi:hypothetical protein